MTEIGADAAGGQVMRAGWFTAGRALALFAIALMIFGAYYPIYDVLPGPGFQVLANIAIAFATLGGLIAPAGSRVAFTLLWGTFGMSAAIGTISIFSVGYFYLLAAIFLLFTIFATPNRSDIELCYDMRFIAAFAIGYLGMFFVFFLFASRF